MFDENVLYSAPGLVAGGPLVEGITNRTETRVDFFGAGEDLFTPSVGQARVVAADGEFTDLSIALSEDGTFTSIIFNLNTVDDGKASASPSRARLP